MEGEREEGEERGGPSEVVTKPIQSGEEGAFGKPDSVQLLAHLRNTHLPHLRNTHLSVRPASHAARQHTRTLLPQLGYTD
jgi:hypothetical protein